MTELSLHNTVSEKEIDFISYIWEMKKFKLVKDKWYFQSLRETKSVKELDDWAVEISWYASTKDKDRWWDIVEPQAFQSALERYMTNPIVLLQHKTDKPIGIVEEADIDDNWLFIKAKISQNTDWVIDLIKNGVLRAFSIWYSIKDYETDVRELADGSYDLTHIIKDLELYEISVVSIPMNPYALSKSVEDLFEVEEKEAETDESVESEETAEEVVEETVEEAVEESAEVQEEAKEEEVETAEVERSNVVDLWAEENPAEMHIESEATEEATEEADNSDVADTDVGNTEEAVEDVAEETKEADEQSEIVDEESVEEDSENAVETQANDEVVDETSNNEVVETKSIETESQKEFDFDSKIAQISKSFDEKLAIKDKEIEDLKSKVETMTKLFAESLETIDRMTTAVKNQPVASWLAYKRPVRKWWYYDIAEIIKSL